MTNKDDIVIPRAELPEAEYGINHIGPYVTLANNPSSLNYRISASSAAQTRKLAHQQLALAEAIDHALAEDEKKLGAEAGKLYEASRRLLDIQGLTAPAWGKLDANNVTHWEAIARAARELHGK